MSIGAISRRTTLKYFGLLMSSGWLPGIPKASALPKSGVAELEAAGLVSVASQEPYVPCFFRPAEFETVAILAEMIIPTDDRPGAREAHVSNYIDFITFSSAEFKPALQQTWIEGLRLLDELSEKKYGHAFREASIAQREQLLTEMSQPEFNPSTTHPGFNFYKLVKEMSVEGFYTSKKGLIDGLDYKGLTYLNEFPGCTHPEHH